MTYVGSWEQNWPIIKDLVYYNFSKLDHKLWITYKLHGHQTTQILGISCFSGFIHSTSQSFQLRLFEVIQFNIAGKTCKVENGRQWVKKEHNTLEVTIGAKGIMKFMDYDM